MSENEDIDNILAGWPFDPLGSNVRELQLADRTVLQMRVDMGLLQMETDGRPDGTQPEGKTTFLDHLRSVAAGDSVGRTGLAYKSPVRRFLPRIG